MAMTIIRIRAVVTKQRWAYEWGLGIPKIIITIPSSVSIVEPISHLHLPSQHPTGPIPPKFQQRPANDVTKKPPITSGACLYEEAPPLNSLHLSLTLANPSDS
jgi:hypothetical protein